MDPISEKKHGSKPKKTTWIPSLHKIMDPDLKGMESWGWIQNNFISPVSDQQWRTGSRSNQAIKPLPSTSHTLVSLNLRNVSFHFISLVIVRVSQSGVLANVQVQQPHFYLTLFNVLCMSNVPCTIPLLRSSKCNAECTIVECTCTVTGIVECTCTVTGIVIPREFFFKFVTV